MRRTLISADNTSWQNARGIVAAAILIPVALMVKLLVWPFERPVKRTPEEVADILRAFIDGTGGDWDWDDFVSVPIASPQLDSIRVRASRFPGLVSDLDALTALLHEAEALASPVG